MTPVLTVPDAAKLLDCSAETVRERAPELGGLKFGRDWVFPAETFLERLNEMARKGRERKRVQPAAVVQPLGKKAPPRLPCYAAPDGVKARP